MIPCGFRPSDDFNPRSLHGERLMFSSHSLHHLYFNPRSLHGERRESRQT